MSRRKSVIITTIFRDQTPRVREVCSVPAGNFDLDQLLRARLAECESFFPGRRFLPVHLKNGNVNLVEVEEEKGKKPEPEKAKPKP